METSTKSLLQDRVAIAQQDEPRPRSQLSIGLQRLTSALDSVINEEAKRNANIEDGKDRQVPRRRNAKRVKEDVETGDKDENDGESGKDQVDGKRLRNSGQNTSSDKAEDEEHHRTIQARARK